MPETSKAIASTSRYVVLAKAIPDDAGFREVGRFSAPSGQTAKRMAAERMSADLDKVDRIVAVPERSWQPQKVRVEAEPKIVLE